MVNVVKMATATTAIEEYSGTVGDGVGVFWVVPKMFVWVMM